MSKSCIACATAFLLVFTDTAPAKRIAVLYRGDILPCLAIVDALEQRPNDKILSLDILKADKQSPGIDKRLHAFRPDFVVAVGKGALQTAARVGPRVPVVFGMVLNPLSVLKGKRNRLYVGVGMYVDPDRQAKMFVQSLPGAKRVGIIYTRKYSGDVARQFIHALSAKGVAVINTRVSDSRSALAALDGMKKRVDAYWLLPDRVVMTPEFMHRLMKISFRQSQPVISFSRKGVHSGACLAMVFNGQDLARALNRLLDRFKPFRDLLGVKVLPLSQGRLIINLTVLQKMGIKVRDSTIFKASEVY